MSKMMVGCYSLILLITRQRQNGPFPAHIAAPGKRPDGITLGHAEISASMLSWKRNSPWEANFTDSYIRKKSSYTKLESDCRSLL